ncbi:MAG: sensor histidine kinase, partial [Pseudomonadota bacterium]
MLSSLSGRFLILTVLFVMLAEVLIFVPSIARHRLDYLTNRMERAQIAALALLGAGDMIDPDVEAELLENAGVLNVVLRRDALRQLVLSSELPGPVSGTVDLRNPQTTTLIRDAMARYFMPEEEIIRVIGQPAREGGLQIEVAIHTGDLRQSMLDYGLNILILSAVISIITASLLFLAVRRLMVLPIKSLVGEMNTYAAAPEDARRVIEPSSSIRELYEAETSLQSLETQLTQSLRQKERLAQLGSAVAKISHDLRNILNVATLVADRLETSEDPGVRRVTPRLVNSLSRAVNLCESAL